MKEPLSQYISPEPQSLVVENIRYLDNGPYSLQIHAGEIVGLTGQSGIGKSQLLRALTDLSEWQGSIRYGQHDIFSMPAVQWRKLVGYIPAETAWWYDTVAEHFKTASSFTSGENALLGKLGFSQDVLNWSISRLSSGERQRLGIFRTLINEPNLLLLDEPTSNLDHDSIVRVEDIFLSLKGQNKAILIISHDSGQIKRLADRQYQMQKESLTELSVSPSEV